MFIKFYCHLYLDNNPETYSQVLEKWLPVIKKALIPIIEDFAILGNIYIPNESLSQEPLQAPYIPLSDLPKWRLSLPFVFQFDGIDHAKNLLTLLETLFRAYAHHIDLFEIKFHSQIVEDEEQIV